MEEVIRMKLSFKSSIFGKIHRVRENDNWLYFSPNDACIYRLLGSRFDEVEFFTADFPISCDKGHLWIYSKTRQEGPFCRNSTHSRLKRSVEEHNQLVGQRYEGDEIDVVIQNTGNEAIPISFGFNLGTW